jgi:hypothetical protein
MKKILLLLLVVLLSVGIAANVSAQELPYLFHVEKTVVNQYLNADGTTSRDYTWVFDNQPLSHPIDFVDVGVGDNYVTNTVTADVNGVPVSISGADYQGNGIGFAIVLGDQAIPAGSTGTVHVYIGSIRQVLYQDKTDASYFSMGFIPTWFGQQYVTGTTDLTVSIHLPPGLQENEPRWYKSPEGFPPEPVTEFDAEDRITYTWHNPAASASENYYFGASVPGASIPEAIVIGINTPSPSSSSSLRDKEKSGTSAVVMIFVAFIGIYFFVTRVYENTIGEKRKLQYLAPHISIEGHGIKRGLTAVEAAILLEHPLDKIMTMILFGLIKKNAAEVTSRDPLEIKAASPLPEGLHEYELGFIRSYTETTFTRRESLQKTAVDLVKSVNEKLRGFSLKETVDFYRSIVEKAWEQVESADTPEVRSQKLEESFEWTLLDKKYEDRARRVFKEPIFLPAWWTRYDPAYIPRQTKISHPTTSLHLPQTASGLSSPVQSQSSVRSALPGAEFAAQMVTGVQSLSEGIVGNVNLFTERVTGITNPPPKKASSSFGGEKSGRSSGRSDNDRHSGGGGGRSCACACACAGCACACAGGGR